ncbi:hypothetical protein [Paraliomyxa miuraensis]|uniref:hypothetical protein n=1 Tax=Paraliomyxa miuraensis TaxID=376150 RepID=UPI002251C24A|nr:hypothetical protein [Paraliomyxa miuraensis]MCX4240938.1 hypothetical protein [Paraliomyxa miuraensis]
MTRLPGGPLWSIPLALVACGVTQRPSVKLVDPTLVAEGTVLERTRHREKGLGPAFGLGPYVVHGVGVRSESPDPEGPLAREDARRPVTQHRATLVLDAPDTQRSWTALCILQRRVSAQADFRAVLDENGDEVSVECTATARGQVPWRLSVRTVLSRNFVGSLGREGDAPGPDLEVLTRAIHFKRLERVLPVPVAQLRQEVGQGEVGQGEVGQGVGQGGGKERRAVLAMLLGRPERAWVAKDLDPITTEATLALMTTLSLLPWELAE